MSIPLFPGVITFSKIDSISQVAFDLLRRSPSGAAFTMCLTTSDDTYVWNGSTMGDLWVYCQEAGGLLSVRVDQVIGFGKMPTMPNETRLVDKFQSESFVCAAEQLTETLHRAIPNDFRLRIRQLFYRHNCFAELSFSQDRGKLERFQWIRRRIGAADVELTQSIQKLVEKALAWGGDKFLPKRVSLWFSCDSPERTSGRPQQQIYLTITPEGRSFEVIIDDRALPDWGKTVLSDIEGLDELKMRIASYFSRNHAFDFNSMTVYFAYSIVDRKG